MNDDPGDLVQSSIEGLAGQEGVAEAAAAQNQQAGHVLQVPRLGDDCKSNTSPFSS